jgi:hypothetical protein
MLINLTNQRRSVWILSSAKSRLAYRDPLGTRARQLRLRGGAAGQLGKVQRRTAHFPPRPEFEIAHRVGLKEGIGLDYLIPLDFARGSGIHPTKNALKLERPSNRENTQVGERKAKRSGIGRS